MGFNFDIYKEDICKYKFVKPSHSVCISGVDLDKDNNVIMWKTKNSISNKINEGYIYMSKERFMNHCYVIYVNKEYLRKAILDIFKLKAINSDKVYK